MEKNDLLAMLRDKEKMKEQTEFVYQQILGQIALLRDLIGKEDKPIIQEEVKKE